VLKNSHRETGTVCTVCQAGTAIHVRIAQELLCVCNDRSSGRIGICWLGIL
jgi:hypothetical protein